MQRQGGPGEDVMRPLQPYIAVSDCDLIERIIANMISNAVKFTSSGAVQPFICPVETYYPDVNGVSVEGGRLRW
jgi:signal transduction histidine kinase